MVALVDPGDGRTEARLVDARLDGHEELCAERYSAIIARLDRLEKMIGWAAGLIMVSLIGLICTLLPHARF